MNSKQQKAYDAQLDKMDLTDSQRDAFDHSAKRSLIDLDTYQHTDNFSLHGYKLSKVMDEINTKSSIPTGRINQHTILLKVN